MVNVWNVLSQEMLNITPKTELDYFMCGVCVCALIEDSHTIAAKAFIVLVRLVLSGNVYIK